MAAATTPAAKGGSKLPIPDYQTLLRPLLEHLSDGVEHPGDETSTVLVRVLRLSDEERNQLRPKGKGTVFGNRMAFAKAKLKEAGMIDSPSPGVYRILPTGAALLKQTTGPITLKELNPGKHGGADVLEEPPPEAMTDEEHIEYLHRQIRKKLATDLLERIKNCPPAFFEQLVVDLIVKMRYGVGQAVGRTGDGGIDGVIKQDSLGLETIYLQAKRWDGVVGRPEIHKFAGALAGQKARKGIFVTTSSFTREAQEYATSIDPKIILIDGKQLAELLIDNGEGVTDQVHALKNVESSYFVTHED